MHVVLCAAALDRKFDLLAMMIFIAAGVVALDYRLVVDPGVAWAIDNASIFELVLAYGGIFISLILFRIIEASVGGDGHSSHWGHEGLCRNLVHIGLGAGSAHGN